MKINIATRGDVDIDDLLKEASQSNTYRPHFAITALIQTIKQQEIVITELSKACNIAIDKLETIKSIIHDKK